MKKLIQRAKTIVQDMLTDLFYTGVFKNLDNPSIAIDCSANVGKISTIMAQTGAQVFAFEPNPYAFRHLQQQVKPYPNVTCIPKAVGTEECTMNLYFHQEATDDDLFWSFGSSLVAEKFNVNNSRSIEIEVIDMVDFIKTLDAPVELLKIDVEGAECEILEKLIETETHQEIGKIVVETHDSKIPDQKKKPTV